jgi:hypothetical protein
MFSLFGLTVTPFCSELNFASNDIIINPSYSKLPFKNITFQSAPKNIDRY